MCPLGWRLIVVSMGSVWREETVDLGVQSNETFGDNSNIVARAFADDLEMMPQVFAHPAHFYPECLFYPVNPQRKPSLDAVNAAAKIVFDTPQIGSKGLDCFRGFDVHRSRGVILPSSSCEGRTLVRLKPDATYEGV